MPMPDAIDLEAITVERGGRRLLEDVSWRVGRGSCCALIGPNGAGKSTLLAVITGFLWPQRGRARVLGERLGEVELIRLRRRIGIVGQSRLPRFHDDMTALETVLAGRFGTVVVPPHLAITGVDRAAALRELETVGLAERAGDELGRLSSGERMRVLLARALVARPELLILDEPTASLDLGGRAAFVEALEGLLAARRAMSVVIVTHHVEDLPRGLDQAVLLRGGRVLAAGRPAEVLTSAGLSELFQCAVELSCEQGRYWTRVRAGAPWRL